MNDRSQLNSLFSNWIMAAIACAALPLLHGEPRLQTLGQFAPLILALVLGFGFGIPILMTIRRLAGPGPAVDTLWAALSTGQAALLGVLTWGLPLGLVFSSHAVLKSGATLASLPGIVVWPLAGIATGISMRRIALKKAEGEQAS